MRIRFVCLDLRLSLYVVIYAPVLPARSPLSLFGFTSIRPACMFIYLCALSSIPSPCTLDSLFGFMWIRSDCTSVSLSGFTSARFVCLFGFTSLRFPWTFISLFGTVFIHKSSCPSSPLFLIAFIPLYYICPSVSLSNPQLQNPLSHILEHYEALINNSW